VEKKLKFAWGQFSNFAADDLVSAIKIDGLLSSYDSVFSDFIEGAMFRFIPYAFAEGLTEDDRRDTWYELHAVLRKQEDDAKANFLYGLEMAIDDIAKANFDPEPDTYDMDYSNLALEKKGIHQWADALVVLHIVDDLMGAFDKKDTLTTFHKMRSLMNIAHMADARISASIKARKAAKKGYGKSGRADVKQEVLKCLEERGDAYKNKATFIRDMLDKFGDKIKTPKTIERYVDQSEHRVPHWRARRPGKTTDIAQ
jgi:hypothetical protein